MVSAILLLFIGVLCCVMALGFIYVACHNIAECYLLHVVQSFVASGLVVAGVVCIKYYHQIVW